jgi:mycofactocin precursor
MALPRGPPPNVDPRRLWNQRPPAGTLPEGQEDPVEDSGRPSQDELDDTGMGGGAAADSDGVVEELLVEEVSIDGMCGVY